MTAKGARADALWILETLRDEPRDRTVVVVGIVESERAELDLAVVEEEARRVVEADIRVRILLASVRGTEA